MIFARIRRPLPALLGLLGLAIAAGCSTDSPVPECVNCEAWTQVTTGLARFPEPHPVDPSFLLYSTIDKISGAADADRESDEDLWLLQRTGSDPSEYPRWQLTDDTIGPGDNLAGRWSPSGTQIAFVHSTGGGNFEVWRVPVTLPATSADPPLLGTAERLVPDARDVAWATETRIVVTRADKLYAVDLPVGPGPPITAPRQLTFNPPLFASTDEFIDRHPTFARDGAGIFNTIGRRNSADVFLRAFEIDDTVFPPDTTASGAWVSYRSPEASDASYPIFSGGDTLRTPLLMQSVPVGAGGLFRLGVRRDSRFIANPAIENYCDTLLAETVDLQPGDVDTVDYYFRVVRGTLEIRSGIGQAAVFWTRQDARETIFDFVSNPRIVSPGGLLRFPCLMPFAIESGVVNSARQETLLVTATRGGLADTAKVVLSPGKTTRAELFPTGTISARMTFAGMPQQLPQGLAEVFLAGTSQLIAGGIADDSTGVVMVPNVPEGVFDVIFSVAGMTYADTTVTGVVVTPSNDTSLGTIPMRLLPGAHPVRDGAVRRAPEVPAPARTVTAERTLVREGPPLANAAALASPFRADGDLTTVWRLDLDPAAAEPPDLAEIVGSAFQIQNPAITEDFAGVRYLAYSSDETGDWQLFVQRLVNWQRDGDPVRILTPGSVDNLSCQRDVFHPRWVPGSGPGSLQLFVALGDCPGNGFEDLGIDDDPWAVGEIRIWRVELPAGL